MKKWKARKGINQCEQIITGASGPVHDHSDIVVRMVARKRRRARKRRVAVVVMGGEDQWAAFC